MKTFLSSLCVSVSMGVMAIAGSAVVSSEAQAVPSSYAQAKPLLKTAGNYLDPMYFPSTEERNGTVVLRTPLNDGSGLAYFCSGTVVSPTQIITAAHCVDTHDPRSPDYGTTTATNVYFGGYAGTPIQAANYEIHPLYFDPVVGSPAVGAFATGDLAIVTLSEPIPAGTKIYGLYNGDPYGKVATHISYGTTGNGDGTNETFNLDPLQNGRIGKNLYETDLFTVFEEGLAGAHLLYDFDDGTLEHNALAWWMSPVYDLGGGWLYVDVDPNIFPDLGLGLEEVLIDGGDSGGGAFIDGLLAGVHSFGVTLSTTYCNGIANPFNPEILNPADVTCGNDSSFGEIAGDTNIAFFYDWIMQRLVFPAVEVPAPATLSLFGLGLLGLGLGRRRRT